MTATFKQVIPAAFTDTSGPKLYPDFILNSGSKLLFDTSNPLCNALPVGALTAGQTLANLVSGGAAATVASSTNPMVNNGSNLGISMAGVAANGGEFNLGTGFSLYGTDHRFIALCWLKLNPTGQVTTNSNIFSLKNDVPNTLFAMDAGVGNIAPRVNANAQASSAYTTLAGFTPGAVQMIGVAWEPQGSGSVYHAVLNGAVQTSITQASPSLLVNTAAASMVAGSSRFAGKLYDWYFEDLTLSGASVVNVVQREYALRAGVFA